MGIEKRVELYQQMERLRKRPLLVYVTSSRVNAPAQIAADVVPEFLDQLQTLPKDCEELDLLLVSNGGDPTVAWRVVSLIRERVKNFTVLVPQAAFSAATLIALGADEIVMHPHGNLGPTDPQITANRRNHGNGQTDSIPFGSEDLRAFLKFARETVGLSDQGQIKDVFAKFCDEVGTVAIGVAARSSQLGVAMGEKLLQLHMTGDNNKQKARTISEKLTRDYFHHGYPVSKTEAKEIGLKVAKDLPEIENLMWQIWLNISEELSLRQPFLAFSLIAKDPAYSGFFALPPPGQPAQPQQITTRFENIGAVTESARLASRFLIGGMVVATRNLGQPMQMQTIVDLQEWRTVWPPVGHLPSATVNPGTAVKSPSGPPKAGRKRAVK
jgi:hypothetical protein